MALRIYGKLPSTAGRGTLSDRQGSGGNAPREPPHLAGVSQQQAIALYPFGGQGALSRIGSARVVGSELPKAAGIRRLHEKRKRTAPDGVVRFLFIRWNRFLKFTIMQIISLNRHVI